MAKNNKTIAIVKYNAGNIRSVVNAVRRLGAEPLVTDDAAELRSADRVIFPGQGEASNAMAYLRERGLDAVIRSLTCPVLGICIGMQLLCRHSEEGPAGGTDCLGLFDVDVKRFQPVRREDKIPQMGWNSLHDVKSPLMQGIADGDFVYFVHSYYVPLCDHTIATTHFTTDYSSALHRDNFFATQFHPEKSGDVGHRILENFLNV